MRALARRASAVPLATTAVAALLVLVAPFRVWVWSVVILLAVTAASSPVLAVYRYDVRTPTAEEAAAIVGLSDLGCGVLVVEGARDGPVNGYAIGGPFRDVVGISEFALSRLPPDQVAALLAHEVAHHRGRPVLLRGGVSVTVLTVGAAVTAALFDALVPAAALCLITFITVERVVAFWVMRRFEYRADAAAARRTSVESVTSLLSSLKRATVVDQARPVVLQLFSTHPPYAARMARLRDGAPGDGPASTPTTAR